MLGDAMRPLNDEIDGFALSGGDASVGDCALVLWGEATLGDSRGDGRVAVVVWLWGLRGGPFVKGGRSGVLA